MKYENRRAEKERRRAKRQERHRLKKLGISTGNFNRELNKRLDQSKKEAEYKALSLSYPYLKEALKEEGTSIKDVFETAEKQWQSRK